MATLSGASISNSCGGNDGNHSMSRYITATLYMATLYKKVPLVLKISYFVSTEQRMSCRFWMTYGRVNNDSVILFVCGGWGYVPWGVDTHK